MGAQFLFTEVRELKMLPSAYRLKERSSFRRVYGRGKSCVTDLVVVYVLPNRIDTTRIGFSVSKKLGKSVDRNRVKRLLREASRQVLPHIAMGYDVVIVARRKAAGASYASLLPALAGLFKKSGILKARD